MASCAIWETSYARLRTRRAEYRDFRNSSDELVPAARAVAVERATTCQGRQWPLPQLLRLHFPAHQRALTKTAATPARVPYPTTQTAVNKDACSAGGGPARNLPWKVEFPAGGFFTLGGGGGGGAKIFPPAALFNSGPVGSGPASLQLSSYFFGDGPPL